MTVTHLKKKDIVKSSVKGIAVEFDHEKLASILGIPGNNGILIDEAAVEGESGSGEKFYDAEDKEQDSPAENEEISTTVHGVQLSRRNKVPQESTPRVLLEDFLKL
ncbi:hypothetical protein Dimus_013780 [Dionaea muscipula]